MHNAVGSEAVNMKKVLAIVGVVVCATGIVASAEQHSGNLVQAPGSTPLFTQCPPVGLDTGCATLITINANGSVSTATDSNQPPYDGDEDQLIGIQNNLGAAVCSITLSSNQNIFGFDEDGLCTETPSPSDCPFGPTGYEGKGTSFDIVDDQHGTVKFQPCIRPGGSAYFSLEEAVLGEITFPAIGTQSLAAPALGPIALFGLGLGLTAVGVRLVSRRSRV
ncbi:MAG: hypothetical protein ACHQ9S_22075 [Candidatus Binatia bacterium]